MIYTAHNILTLQAKLIKLTFHGQWHIYLFYGQRTTKSVNTMQVTSQFTCVASTSYIQVTSLHALWYNVTQHVHQLFSTR